MDFRRIPFQFTTTDPLKRQEELQRRFGLPANKNNMYVDLANPGIMGNRPDNSSASNSPRLQHRVPIFVEGQSETTKPSVDAQNVDSGRKPHVRVIPIEVEGEDNTSKRHRWLSGSSEFIKEKVNNVPISVETTEHPAQNPSPQSSKAPRICNIPIKIEGSDRVIRPTSPVRTEKERIPVSPKHPRLNGCSASKVAKLSEKHKSNVNEKKKTPEQMTLIKIQNIEEKLKGYHGDVEAFSGTNKEKQYRYLDEMLTRCMLELDEIDTMGLESIRLARKTAVKKVQASIDLLESKVIVEESKHEQVLEESMEVEASTNQLSENADDIDIDEIKNYSTDVPVDTSTIKDQVGEAIERTNLEMANTFPEQIKDKVENILIKREKVLLKPDYEVDVESDSNIDNPANVTNEKMNVEVTKIDSGADTCSELETPVVEELTDSKDENALDMVVDSCNCESDGKLDDTSSVQICEIENDSVSDLDFEAGTSEQSDQLNMEVTETSNIPVVTETMSNANIQVAMAADESTVAEQSILSTDLRNDSTNILQS